MATEYRVTEEEMGFPYLLIRAWGTVTPVDLARLDDQLRITIKELTVPLPAFADAEKIENLPIAKNFFALIRGTALMHPNITGVYIAVNNKLAQSIADVAFKVGRKPHRVFDFRVQAVPAFREQFGSK